MLKLNISLSFFICCARIPELLYHAIRDVRQETFDKNVKCILLCAISFFLHFLQLNKWFVDNLIQCAYLTRKI